MIVPGHGPVGTHAELEQYVDMLSAIREKVAALKKQGLTLDQTIAAAPSSAFDAKYGGGLVNPGTFTTLVYAGV